MNTGKNNNKGLYIIIFLAVLVIFILVFRDEINKNNLINQTISSDIESFKLQDTDIVLENESFIDNVFNLKFNIAKAIMSREITWLNYFNNIENEKKSNIANFNLNENDVVKNENNSQPDMNVYDPSLKQTLDKNKPQVYIYHSHTTESYFNVSIDFKDSREKKYNISGAGEILSNILENDYGIASKHDDTIHNEVYIGSYKHSRETLQQELINYSGYNLIIDMHRDASDNKEAQTININGENVAKIMFVLDIQHEGAEKNIQLANDLIAISNRLFPGFCKGTYTYDGGSSYFNQDLSGNNVLIEVGANCNTLEEAQNSQKYIARIIAEYLSKK